MRMSAGVRIGRPPRAGHRCVPDDPVADAIVVTPGERGALLHRWIRIGGTDPRAKNMLRSVGLTFEGCRVEVQVFHQAPSVDPTAAVTRKPGIRALKAVDADVALGMMTGDPSVHVVVLDSGISCNHAEFRGTFSGSYFFVTLDPAVWEGCRNGLRDRRCPASRVQLG